MKHGTFSQPLTAMDFQLSQQPTPTKIELNRVQSTPKRIVPAVPFRGLASLLFGSATRPV